MIYDFVKETANGYEFINDSGYIYGDVVYGSQSLMSMSSEELSTIGIKKTVMLSKPKYTKESDGTYYFELQGDLVGYRPNYIKMTELEIKDQVISEYEELTIAYIQSKVDEYNLANGLKFKDIDAFSKYAVNSASSHYVIANRFIVWVSLLWESLRTWQDELTTIPTEQEWMDIVNKVEF